VPAQCVGVCACACPAELCHSPGVTAASTLLLCPGKQWPSALTDTPIQVYSLSGFGLSFSATIPLPEYFFLPA